MGWRANVQLDDSDSTVEVEIRSRKGRAYWISSLFRMSDSECLTGRQRIISEVGPRREAAEESLMKYLNTVLPGSPDWRFVQPDHIEVLDLMRECPVCHALILSTSKTCKWCGPKERAAISS